MSIPPTYHSRTRSRRRGETLLELVLATSLTAIAIVPPLSLMRKGLVISREIETRHLLTTLAVSKLEEHLALASASWTTASLNGDFAGEGYADLHYQVDRTDDIAGGEFTDQLMQVTVTTWEEENTNNLPDSGEMQITFRSKIAKLATYQSQVGP